MTVNYLKMEILSFQSRINPLRLSSLKGWVRGSAFSADGFLIPTPQIHYRSTTIPEDKNGWKQVANITALQCNSINMRLNWRL